MEVLVEEKIAVFSSVSEKFFLCKVESHSMTSWQGDIICYSKVNKSYVLSVPSNLFLQHFMPFCKLTAPDNVVIFTENKKGHLETKKIIWQLV